MTSKKLTLTRVPNWKWLGSVNSANSERRNLRKKGSQGGIAVVTLIGTTCIFSLWSSQGNGAITINMNVFLNHLIYHPPVPLSTNRRNILIYRRDHSGKIKIEKIKKILYWPTCRGFDEKSFAWRLPCHYIQLNTVFVYWSHPCVWLMSTEYQIRTNLQYFWEGPLVVPHLFNPLPSIITFTLSSFQK